MAILGRYKASAAGHCTEIGDDKIKCCGKTTMTSIFHVNVWVDPMSYTAP